MCVTQSRNGEVAIRYERNTQRKMQTMRRLENEENAKCEIEKRGV